MKKMETDQNFREYIVGLGNDNRGLRYLTDSYNRLLVSHPFEKGHLFDATDQRFATQQIPVGHIVQARPNQSDNNFVPLEKKVLSVRDIGPAEAFDLIQRIPIRAYKLSGRHEERIICVNSENIIYPIYGRGRLEYLSGTDTEKDEGLIEIGNIVAIRSIIMDHTNFGSNYQVTGVRELTYPEFSLVVSENQKQLDESRRAIENIKRDYRLRMERLEEAKKRELSQAGNVPNLSDELKKLFFGGEN